MVIETRIGTVQHDYDRRTGARRLLISFDLVAVGIAAVVSVLGVRFVRRGLPRVTAPMP